MCEPAGFHDYVVARQLALVRTAWLLTGDRQAAEDLVQTALMKVWPKWDRLCRDGDPDAYVRRALLNCYLTWRRRRWHGERPTGDLPERPAPGDAYSSADLRDALARLLPTLPARQRAAVVLRFYEQLSEQETAQVLDCSVGTVKSQVSKALAKLRATISLDAPLTGERR